MAVSLNPTNSSFPVASANRNNQEVQQAVEPNQTSQSLTTNETLNASTQSVEASNKARNANFQAEEPSNANLKDNNQSPTEKLGSQIDIKA